MEKLDEILKEINPNIDLDNENFIDNGFLTSFDIVTLVAELNDAFKINITIKELTPENFANKNSILKMIKTLEK
jgi:D-alanine--poly(phosphoribitol) ligase subunit 2